MHSDEVKRKDYKWWLGLGILVFLSAAVLTAKDREWFHRDISFAYALFASVSFAISSLLVLLFAGLIGGWVLDWLPPLRRVADRIEGRSARLFLAFVLLIGLIVIVAIIWFVKDIPLEPLDDF